MRPIRGRAQQARPRPGERLRELRQAQGLSHRDLAAAIRAKVGEPVGHNKLSEMEIGETRINPKYWVRVSKYFGVKLGPSSAREALRANESPEWSEVELALLRARSHGRGRALAERAIDAETEETGTAPGQDNAPGADPGATTGDFEMQFRQITLAQLSDQTRSLFELEALIFVAAVTHNVRAMEVYFERPEDYRGRLAALRSAIDDADRYGRAHYWFYNTAGTPQLVDGHLPEESEFPLYERSIERWLRVHGPTILDWAGTGPYWDQGLTYDPEEREDGRPSLLDEIRDWWGK